MEDPDPFSAPRLARDLLQICCRWVPPPQGHEHHISSSIAPLLVTAENEPARVSSPAPNLVAADKDRPAAAVIKPAAASNAATSHRNKIEADDEPAGAFNCTPLRDQLLRDGNSNPLDATLKEVLMQATSDPHKFGQVAPSLGSMTPLQFSPSTSIPILLSPASFQPFHNLSSSPIASVSPCNVSHKMPTSLPMGTRGQHSSAQLSPLASPWAPRSFPLLSIHQNQSPAHPYLPNFLPSGDLGLFCPTCGQFTSKLTIQTSSPTFDLSPLRGKYAVDQARGSNVNAIRQRGGSSRQTGRPRFKMKGELKAFYHQKANLDPG